MITYPRARVPMPVYIERVFHAHVQSARRHRATYVLGRALPILSHTRVFGSISLERSRKFELRPGERDQGLTLEFRLINFI